MENKKRRKKLLISGLLLLISGIILFAIAAGLALSFASGAEGFPSARICFCPFQIMAYYFVYTQPHFYTRWLCSSDKNRHIWIKRQPKRLTFYFFLRGTPGEYSIYTFIPAHFPLKKRTVNKTARIVQSANIPIHTPIGPK